MLHVTWLAGICLFARGGPEADPWDRLLQVLFTRRIEAQLHRSLLKTYQVPESQSALQTENELEFTRLRFPLTMTHDSEEWPTIYSGSLFLLDDPLFAKTIDLLQLARKEPLDRRTPFERLHLQSDLWAVFDGLFLDGTQPGALQGPAHERWRRLLQEIAGVMRHVALSPEEIRRLPTSSQLLREVLRRCGAPEARTVEYYTAETFVYHDASHRFRRSNHFFYWDPSRDFMSLSAEDLDLLSKRWLRLSEGSVAVLQENLFAVAPDGSIHPTSVPALFKVYRVIKSGGEERPLLEFSLFRMDRKAATLSDEALLRAPEDAEAWAQIDLPNMPNAMKPALRAPLAVTCRGCHGPTPNAFRPAMKTLDVSLWRMSRNPQLFTASRNVTVKTYSAEHLALKRYFLADSYAQLADGPDRAVEQGAPIPLPAPEPPTPTIWTYTLYLGILGAAFVVCRAVIRKLF